MSRWLAHHMELVFSVGIVGVAALTAYAFGRAWWVLVPFPALLAAFAWYGWDYSAEAAPLALAIAVLAYTGMGIGVVARHARRRARLA